MDKNIQTSKITKKGEIKVQPEQKSIKQLVFDARWLRNQLSALKDKNPEITDQTLNQEAYKLILDSNYLIRVMQIVKDFYNINIDNADVERIVDIMKKNAKPGKQIPAQMIDQMRQQAKNIIEGELIFNELVTNEFKITITDKDVEEDLNEYYRRTNASIREIKENKNGQLDKYKADMIKNRLTMAAVKKFEISIDFASVEQQANNVIHQINQVMNLYNLDLTLWSLIKRQITESKDKDSQKKN